jgi:hypothetical protein
MFASLIMLLHESSDESKMIEKYQAEVVCDYHWRLVFFMIFLLIG